MNRRKRMLDGLDEEIRDHIEREVDDNVGRGMSPEEARRAALRRKVSLRSGIQRFQAHFTGDSKSPYAPHTASQCVAPSSTPKALRSAVAHYHAGRRSELQVKPTPQ